MAAFSRTGPEGFVASDDPALVDVDVVHAFLTTAYWSPGVTRDVVARSLAGSTVIGVYSPEGAQVAFARAVTDRATFAWIADVFVLPSHRGRGLGRLVVATLLDHPDLQGMRRFMLATADAHSLYAGYGFRPLDEPARFMERRSGTTE